MATLRDMTGAKRALQALLLATLPAALTTVETDDGRAIGLEMPSDDAIVTHELPSFASFPAIEIIGDASVPEGGEDQVEQDCLAYTHRLGVFATVSADDVGLLTARVELMGQAIVEVLHGAALDDLEGFETLTTGQADYSPVARVPNQSAFIKSVAIDVFVATRRDKD